MSYTTPGGLFRFPYAFNDMLTQLLDAVQSGGHVDPDVLSSIQSVISQYMDRDRALEDYLSQARGRFPWIVVAADGSGDYLTVKSAVESVPIGSTPPTTNGPGPQVIVVKTSAGGYTDTAKISIPNDSNIVVIASVPYQQTAVNETPDTHVTSPGFGCASRYQQYTMAGFNIAGANTQITFIGFDIDTGSNQIIADQSGGGLTVNSQNCRWLGTGPFFGSMSGAGQTCLSFTDCWVNPTMHRDAYGTTYMNATRTRFMNFAPGTVTTASLEGVDTLANKTEYWNFTDCQIEGIGTLVLADGDSDYDTQQVRFTNCNFSGTSLEMRFNSSIHLIGCTSADLATLKISGSVSNQELRQNVQLIGNIMPATHVNITVYNTLNETSGFITGLYNRLTLGSAIGTSTTHQAAYTGNVVLKATGNSQTLMTITGKNNLFLAQLSGQGYSGVTGVNMSGSNNRIIYTSEGLGTAVTDSGSSNWANGGLDVAIFDAKGDLLVGSAADAAARLAVGANDYVLTADSAQTLGVKWAASQGILKTLIDAKGDLVVGSANDTAARLGVGADTYVLTADAAATYGIKWAAGSTAGGNILTGNQASVETDTTGWAVDTGCTIARSTAQASHGVGSLALTRT